MDCRAGRGKPYFGRGGFHGNQAAPGNVGKRGRKIRGTFKVETHVFLHEKGIKESSPGAESFGFVEFIIRLVVESLRL